MTPEQQKAVRLLSRCRMYHRRERDRVKLWKMLLECDPKLELAPYEDRALMHYFHHYRAQHKQCRCEKCFAAIMAKATLPTQMGLFDTPIGLFDTPIGLFDNAPRSETRPEKGNSLG